VCSGYKIKSLSVTLNVSSFCDTCIYAPGAFRSFGTLRYPYGQPTLASLGLSLSSVNISFLMPMQTVLVPIGPGFDTYCVASQVVPLGSVTFNPVSGFGAPYVSHTGPAFLVAGLSTYDNAYNGTVPTSDGFGHTGPYVRLWCYVTMPAYIPSPASPPGWYDPVNAGGSIGGSGGTVGWAFVGGPALACDSSVTVNNVLNTSNDTPTHLYGGGTYIGAFSGTRITTAGSATVTPNYL
jgi:hypothetical protein